MRSSASGNINITDTTATISGVFDASAGASVASAADNIAMANRNKVVEKSFATLILKS